MIRKSQLKLGWNWEFVFSEELNSDKAPITIVAEKLVFCDKRGVTSNIISGYPYGMGRREDSAMYAIRKVIDDFRQSAFLAGVEVKDVRDRWFDRTLIVAPLDSILVRDFVGVLSRQNRVLVKITQGIKQHEDKHRFIKTYPTNATANCGWCGGVSGAGRNSMPRA